jgi:hypothetical protein
MVDEKPVVPRSGVAMIVDHDDNSSPQNVYAFTTLTPMQLAALRARIKAERTRLRLKGENKSFRRAVLWVYNTFAYDVHLDSDFVPLPTYGATFESFVNFVHRKEIDAQAEEIVEDEDPRE